MSELEDSIEYFDHPAEIWDSRLARRLQAREYANWLSELRPWSIFLTLTFRDDRPPDVAMHLFMGLVRGLNEDAFGKHYRRYVGHSYFSYAIASENQVRDVIHFHVLVDRPLDFSLVHRLWNLCAGFAHTDIIEEREHVVKYICKYISKGGEVLPYGAPKEYMPIGLPAWWKTAAADSEGANGAPSPDCSCSWAAAQNMGTE